MDKVQNKVLKCVICKLKNVEFKLNRWLKRVNIKLEKGFFYLNLKGDEKS
jgi:hypothetical protein